MKTPLRQLCGLALCTLIAGSAACASRPSPERAPSIAAPDDAAALPLFEAALERDPDDLRLANDYRQAVIRLGAYPRALDFYRQLVAAHPRSAHAELNYGYVYVDQIPVAGAVTRVILANGALEHFSRSLELEQSWLGLYTRGNSYLYWPKIFGRAPLAVADLEQAVALLRQEPRRAFHALAYVALGDAYWRTDQPDRARAMWREASQLFPGDPHLAARLERDDAELEAFLYDQLDPNRRVDTDLSVLWAEP